MLSIARAFSARLPVEGRVVFGGYPLESHPTALGPSPPFLRFGSCVCRAVPYRFQVDVVSGAVPLVLLARSYRMRVRSVRKRRAAARGRRGGLGSGALPLELLARLHHTDVPRSHPLASEPAPPPAPTPAPTAACTHAPRPRSRMSVLHILDLANELRRAVKRAPREVGPVRSEMSLICEEIARECIRVIEVVGAGVRGKPTMTSVPRSAECKKMRCRGNRSGVYKVRDPIPRKTHPKQL